MTNKDYTAVVLVVDRSGSMRPIAATVQDTLEEFVSKQLSEPGKLTIDTVFFDDKVENRASFVDPAKEKLDLALEPRGMTALYDAVGMKIDSFGKELSKLSEGERPGKVIFVIATDGHENSSREITQEALASRIGEQREKYDWDFTFIGANQDAVLTAATLNIPEGSAITFAATAGGTESVLRSMSGYVASARAGAPTAYSVADRESAVAPEPGAGDPVAGRAFVAPPAPTAARGGGAAKSRTPRVSADGTVVATTAKKGGSTRGKATADKPVAKKAPVKRKPAKPKAKPEDKE